MTRDVLDLGSWVILRMASADTLRAARSLTQAGLRVWTPVERRVGRTGPSRARAEKEVPLMPSYLFGSVDHLDEFLRLAHTPRRQHPKFSVFHHRGGIPLIADDQLDALRSEQDRRGRVFDKWKRKGMKGPNLAVGSEVRLPDGPFEGISGIVEGTEGRYTLVEFAVFGKPVTIKVASLLLAENLAQDGLPIEAAARAA